MQLQQQLQRSGLGGSRLSSRTKVCCASSLSAFRASTYAPRGPDSTTHGAPQLTNRALELNPFETVGRALDSASQRLDLMFSNVEKHTLGRGLMLAEAALISAACGLGVSMLPLLKSSPVSELLLDVLGLVPGTLAAGAVQLAAVLLSVPLALAHLRLWVAANRVQPAPRQSSSSSSSSIPNWAGAVLAAKRLTCLVAASSLVLNAGAAALSMGTLAAAGTCWLVSVLLLPPLLPQLVASKLTQMGVLPTATPQLSSSQVTVPQVAMSIADAAFIGLLLPLPPLVRATCTAAMAAGLLLAASSPLMQGRLAKHTVEAGDEVSVHVSVQTDNGITIDSTIGSTPLRFQVGKAEEQLQSNLQTSGTEQTQAARLCAIMGDMRGGVDGESESSQFSASSRLERFKRLAGTIDAAVVGALQGETKSLFFYNPPLGAGGFVNPSLTWWQATDDVQRKFKQLPVQGQTFFYPIHPDRPGDWVPVRVGGVNSKFVELDANWVIEDSIMKLAVRVEELKKAPCA